MSVCGEFKTRQGRKVTIVLLILALGDDKEDRELVRQTPLWRDGFVIELEVEVRFTAKKGES